MAVENHLKIVQSDRQITTLSTGGVGGMNKAEWQNIFKQLRLCALLKIKYCGMHCDDRF